MRDKCLKGSRWAHAHCDLPRSLQIVVTLCLWLCVAQFASAQTVIADSTLKSDSVKAKADSIKADTIKAPIGPTGNRLSPLEIGQTYEWSREEMFASGALTLVELLDRVPGVTSIRSGWITSPQFLSTGGDLSRIVIYYDDVELASLDARTGGLLDLSSIQLWTLEHITIVRDASTMRVYLRSWTVNSTSPYTRTDVSTGDEETNIYRGFYGKRYSHGEVLQLGAQQWSSESPRNGGDGDALSLLGRFGISKKSWSVDAFFNRFRTTRSRQQRVDDGTPLPGWDGTRTLGYLRATVKRSETGPWLQFVAATQGLKESTPHLDATAAAALNVPSDTADTAASNGQYYLSGGASILGMQVVLANRIRSRSTGTTVSQEGRLSWNNRFISTQLYAERGSGRPTYNLLEGTVRITPMSFVSVLGAIGKRNYNGRYSNSADEQSARAEVGIKLFGPWLTFGVVTRDTSVQPAPVVFNSTFVPVQTGKVTGNYVTFRGPVWRGIGVDMWGAKWDDSLFYQPEYQSRAELNFKTKWLSRFPSGNFGFNMFVSHEYRSSTYFPESAGTIQSTIGSRTINGLVELRILRGIISYQIRNFTGERYDFVPGFELPRSTAIYGVRWEFWN